MAWPAGIAAGRAFELRASETERALNNMHESLPVFMAIARLLVLRGVNDGLAFQGA